MITLKKLITVVAFVLFCSPAISRELTASKWNCLKISGVTAEYESSVSKKLQESRRELEFLGPEINSMKNCVMVLDSPKFGEIRCTVHAVFQDGDEYLADGSRIDTCEQ